LPPLDEILVWRLDFAVQGEYVHDGGDLVQGGSDF
jgi:hypothetical protein